MKSRTLLMIIMAILSSFAIAMIAFFVLFKFSPSLLGIKSGKGLIANKSGIKNYKKLNQEIIPSISEPLSNQPYKDTQNINSGTVSNQEILDDAQQRELIRNAILANQIEQMIINNNKLKDSLSKYQSINDNFSLAQKKLTDSLKSLANKIKYTNDSLSKYIKLYRDSVVAKGITEKKYIDLVKQNNLKDDSLKNRNLAEFAKIYENTEPQEVAKILQSIDKLSAAKILKLMNKKKAGKVLDVMKADDAADIFYRSMKK